MVICLRLPAGAVNGTQVTSGCPLIRLVERAVRGVDDHDVLGDARLVVAQHVERLGERALVLADDDDGGPVARHE
ncbi:hypothetical protein GCM10025868_20170 [Angustibacter aerolatus]|uniref:Uncharacterized protein n=1 Tax=Angustibacter aerolatus TaxID=1162965 RepID=A0ABQ6JG56_9ACTN|nr:hypothetical protein GCM10025868_20170 [Angustibacter aerolatus]